MPMAFFDVYIDGLKHKSKDLSQKQELTLMLRLQFGIVNIQDF